MLVLIVVIVYMFMLKGELVLIVLYDVGVVVMLLVL